MTARSPGAFMLSATFHAVIVGVFIAMAVYTDTRERVPAKALELVAGEGDNYGATVAPKLGTPGGSKMEVPVIPLPQPLPQKPEPEPEPAPVTPPPEPKTEPAPQPVQPEPKPAPQPKPAPKKTPPPVDMAKQLRQKVANAKAKAIREVAKERAAEEKRMKKEEFDRQQMQRNKGASTTKGSSVKVARIDAEGIAKGVVGGSAENKVGGAGGKALVADGAVMDRYFALLKQKVLSALEKPPGVSDDLAVTVVVNISAAGRLSGARIIKPSGSEEFDRAVLAAFAQVDMPDHPEHKSESLELTFKTKDANPD